MNDNFGELHCVCHVFLRFIFKAIIESSSPKYSIYTIDLYEMTSLTLNMDSVHFTLQFLSQNHLTNWKRVCFFFWIYIFPWKKSDLYFICCCFFSSILVILNYNDFDCLLSRGSNSGPSPRDSILERFDPILGRQSIVPTPLINKTEAAPHTLPSSISTIREVDTICESAATPQPTELLVPTKTPVVETNAVVNDSGDNKETVKLESSEKFEQNIGGDGDISQTSSTTETYETASIGEPLKVIIQFSCCN